ncbi:MAG: RNA polymerase sigma factor [Opitutaceae bacterium]
MTIGIPYILEFIKSAALSAVMLLAPPVVCRSDETQDKPDQLRWFKEEVYPHEYSLRLYLRGRFPDVRDVDDVVQETFLRTWTAGTTQSIRSVKGFLFTVARRLALDLIRTERRSPICAVSDLREVLTVSTEPNAADATTMAQEAELLVDAIESLPRRCREIFLLRKIEGISQREIATRLGLSEQTVQVQSARGMRRCEIYIRRRLNLK